MKIIPGDAFLHTVQGAVGRPRAPGLSPRPPSEPAQGAGTGKPEAAPHARAGRTVERPLPSQGQRRVPRGSTLDITV